MPSAPALNAIALFDSAGLRLVEQRAAQATGDDFELMRRAGRAGWRELLEHWPKARRILVVCGPGNNGGDGYVLATHALMAGRDVRVVTAETTPPLTELARDACRAFVAAGGRVYAFDEALPPADVIVDALFGLGLSRAPQAHFSALIDAINAHGAEVFALDVPSGIDADRGSAPGIAVRAARTLEFIGCKTGLRTGAALDYVGAPGLATLEVESLCAEVPPVATALAADALATWLHPRRRDLHKGHNGRLLCVGGELGGGGAIMLAAEAALRSGAGLVDVATRGAHVAALLARLPEAMVHGCDDADTVDDALARADCVAIGPGLGRTPWARSLLQRSAASGRPLVVDADALNLLAEQTVTLPEGAVLTPHPGEAGRLLGCAASEIQRDRWTAARALSRRFGCTVVLKGAGTIVASADGRMHVIAAGNPGMAVGGMGDVLTGVIAALRVQGLDAFDAAVCGALLHAVAGDSASAGGERGMLPTDLMPALRRHANPGAAR